MADDRYKWLDGDAAERLLRGVPVDAHSAAAEEADSPRNGGGNGADSGEPGGETSPGSGGGTGDARHDEEALVTALQELAAEHAFSTAELPGEAAAVDAFRTAYAGVLRSGSVGVPEAGHAGGGWFRQRMRRSAPMARPLRAGIAMAVAGCALGGVAVAAGTGVLPSPFGGPDSPATSVSPSADRSGDQDRQAAQGGVSTLPDRSPGSETPGGRGEKSPAPPDGERGGKGADRGSGDAGKNGEQAGAAKGVQEKSVRQLCSAYEEKQLVGDDRRRLERAAGGPADVPRFCAKQQGGQSGSGKGAVNGSASGASSALEGSTGSAASGGSSGSNSSSGSSGSDASGSGGSGSGDSDSGGDPGSDPGDSAGVGGGTGALPQRSVGGGSPQQDGGSSGESGDGSVSPTESGDGGNSRTDDGSRDAPATGDTASEAPAAPAP